MPENVRGNPGAMERILTFLDGPITSDLLRGAGSCGVHWRFRLNRLLRAENLQTDPGNSRSSLLRIIIGMQPSVDRFTLSGVRAEFLSGPALVPNTNAEAKPMINSVGSGLASWFGEGEGVLGTVSDGEVHLCSAVVASSLLISSIRQCGLDAFSGLDFISLTEIRRLMADQGSGEAGRLENNAIRNAFLSPDSSGAPRLILVFWENVGWNIDALNLDSLSPNEPGVFRLFCRDDWEIRSAVGYPVTEKARGVSDSLATSVSPPGRAVKPLPPRGYRHESIRTDAL